MLRDDLCPDPLCWNLVEYQNLAMIIDSPQRVLGPKRRLGTASSRTSFAGRKFSPGVRCMEDPELTSHLPKQGQAG